MREDTRHHANENAHHAPSGAAPDAGLARLSELRGYAVADDDPDIRGWQVKTPDGRRVGIVDDLIVDTAAMRARYVEVKADRNVLGVGLGDRRFLVPVAAARLGGNANYLVVDRVPSGGFTAEWSYERRETRRPRGGGGEKPPVR